MIKIIIVDDESITRQWIKKKIEKMDSDYLLVGEFTNGRQALEYCRNHDVDVIFTDICMSNMDGIELLKNIQELGKNPYTVILSAYDEFQYARQALKLGVHDFILKPEITGEGIKKILEEARKYLYERKSNSQNKEQPDEILQYIIEAADGIPEEKLRLIINDNHIKLAEHNLVVWNIYFEKPEVVEKVREIIELFMEEKLLNGYCFPNSMQEYTVIYNHRNDLIRKEVAEELCKILRIHMGEKLFIGISCKKNGFSKVRELYRQALQARENRVFFNVWGCMEYDKLKVSPDNNLEELYCNYDMKEIIQLIEQEKYDEADEKTESLLERLKSADFLPPQYVKTISNEILTTYIHRLWRYTLDTEEQRSVGVIGLQLGENCEKYQELYRKVDEAQKCLSLLLRKKRETNCYSQPIQEVMNYVEAHYFEKILMENIAEKVHLSRTYISVLFKKETGEKFSDYLQRIRLENSCVLLKNTKLSMQEIAEKTGFFDSAHFSRAFKEHYKCSPIEYRKQNNTKKI